MLEVRSHFFGVLSGSRLGPYKEKVEQGKGKGKEKKKHDQQQRTIVLFAIHIENTY